MKYRLFHRILTGLRAISVLLVIPAWAVTSRPEMYVMPVLPVADTLINNATDTTDSTYLRHLTTIRTAPPHHNIYLIDISNSMKEESRLDSLKTGLHYLIHLQREEDRLSVITFNDSAKVILRYEPCTNRERITASIDTLITKGGTNVQDALLDAYKIVDSTRQHYHGNTKLVLVTDGMFDLNKKIRRKIEAYDRAGVPLSIILMGSLHDVETIEFLEKICEKGNGRFYYMRKHNLYEVLVTEASN